MFIDCIQFDSIDDSYKAGTRGRAEDLSPGVKFSEAYLHIYL